MGIGYLIYFIKYSVPLIHSLYATFKASNIHIAFRELNEMINKLNTQNIKLEKPEDKFFNNILFKFLLYKRSVFYFYFFY